MTSRPAEPFYFTHSGMASRPLLGWLHAPTQARSQLGVVICNPLGHESVCAHRSLLHFARALTDAGIPVLRFDYDGTGDSCGTDFDADRLTAWTASVQAAADTLRQLTQVERLCFLGLRFGATLAALAATERNDVAGLIAIAPVDSGRAYLRELRALQLAMDSKEGGESETETVLESAGFLLTKDTQSAIHAIDLTKQRHSPAAQVLIIERDDLPANDRWLAQLRQGGANATQITLPGYVEMMLAPHDAVVPEQMVGAITMWAGELRDHLAANTSREGMPPARFTRDIELASPLADAEPIVEQALFVDETLRMFAIASRPKKMPASPKVIVLLNSGAVHRIGPNRVYVELARNWAARGHVVLRVDISGIGDSPPRPGEPENAVYSACAQRDIETILQYVARHHGVHDVHSVGICSGAYHSFKAAVRGSPFKSAVMINPLTFFWKEGMSLQYPAYRVAADVERYKTNMFSLKSWLKLLRGGVDLVELSQVLLRQGMTVTTRAARELAHLLHLYFRDDLGHELDIVAGRSIDMMFVFSAQDPGLQVLLQQGGATVGKLRKKGKLDIELVELANHTFTALQTREQLVTILTRKFERA